MFSVDEIIERIDQSDEDDNLDDTEGNTQENETEETEPTEGETAEEATNSGNTTKVEPKVRRKQGTRPKLDAERLKGPRGLMCMEKMFSEIEFKGNGYEKHDLNKVMSRLQYWAHRLFPKFTFDDTLTQLERLGTKKPVMTLRKKVLYDMMVEDPVDNDLVDEEQVVVEPEQEPMNDFDMLLNQEPISISFTPTQPAATAQVVELTEEQKEIIARNRELAAEKRRARLEAMKQKETENTANSTSQAQDSQIFTSHSQPLNITDEIRQTIEKNRLIAIEKRRQQFLNKSNNTMSSQSDSIHQASVEQESEIDNTNSEKESEQERETEITEQENLSKENPSATNESEINVEVSQKNNLQPEILSQNLVETSEQLFHEKLNLSVSSQSDSNLNKSSNLEKNTCQEQETEESTSKGDKNSSCSSEHENLNNNSKNETEMDMDVCQENNLQSEIPQTSKRPIQEKVNENPCHSEMDVDISQENNLEI